MLEKRRAGKAGMLLHSAVRGASPLGVELQPGAVCGDRPFYTHKPQQKLSQELLAYILWLNVTSPSTVMVFWAYAP